MNHFLSIRELLYTLSRENKLLSELFEKRKSLSYKYDYALELVDNDNDRIQRLIEKSVIRQNGNYLEIDDQFLQFFEQILEVNEEINISYINENIEQVKQYILYYLQENSESRKYTYLKSVKSTLKKIGRITIRNIVDLNRNIENTFKTEPNYKIKISKLENHNRKLTDIKSLIEQTEKLITDDELTFFKAALDEELKSITNQLRLQLSESRHNLIEAKKQIIEFINQIKYQSKFIEKLRQIKYLKDQFELRAKTNIIDVLVKNSAMAFEIKPTYPLKLSLDWLQKDEVRESIQKINQKIKSGVKPLLHVAESISNDYLQTDTEKEIHINLEEVRNNFMASGNHLFDFILNYKFPRDVLFEERITVFCQMISIFDNNFEVSEDYNEYNEIEYVMVFPKEKMK
jgi:hypothetical protein